MYIDGNYQKFWACDGCETKLAQQISPGSVVILGVSGQKYDIGFVLIKVVCKKCGYNNILENKSIEESDKYMVVGGEAVSQALHGALKDTKAGWATNFLLGKDDKKKLLKNLNEKQQRIYRFIVEDRPADIYEVCEMFEEDVCRDVNFIQGEIEKF